MIESVDIKKPDKELNKALERKSEFLSSQRKTIGTSQEQQQTLISQVGPLEKARVCRRKRRASPFSKCHGLGAPPNYIYPSSMATLDRDKQVAIHSIFTSNSRYGEATGRRF